MQQYATMPPRTPTARPSRKAKPSSPGMMGPLPKKARKKK